MANHETEGSVYIAWDYTPTDYFEERATWERGDYSFEIGEGRAIAKMTEEYYESHPDFKDNLKNSLEKELTAYFLGAQPYRRKPFEFTGGGVTHIYSDGRRSYSPWLSLTLEILPRVNDVVYTDNAGVVHDPRRERIESMKYLARLSVRHAPANPTVRRILNSYDASIRYPENELVYLYEIWDALRNKLGGYEKTLEILDISPNTLTRFRNLTCDLPLDQGRHRGLHDTLQSATFGELEEARWIAMDWIKQYLEYLEDQQKPK